MLKLEVVDLLAGRLGEKSPLIQVVLGPRQVGKTTAMQQLRELKGGPIHYASPEGYLGL